MSEWIRNHKRTDGYPKGLEGKKLEVRQRDGEIFIGIVGKHPWLQQQHFNTSDDTIADVMAYRIIEENPVVQEKDPAKIAPKLWAAYKDVLNDEALAALRDVICNQPVYLKDDKESIYDAFNWGASNQGHDFWADVHSGKYNKPKSAIELQDAEIGIPEPVNEIVFPTVGKLTNECRSELNYYADKALTATALGKSKYHKPCKGVVIDVYDVLVAFNVTCPAMSRAIEKMLVADQNGFKEEAIALIERSIELENK